MVTGGHEMRLADNYTNYLDTKRLHGLRHDYNHVFLFVVLHVLYAFAAALTDST